MKSTRLMALAALLGAILFAQSAQDEMAQGKSAYDAGQFAQAMTDFERALRLDPSNQQAQLSLAAAYYALWMRSVNHPGNEQNQDQTAHISQSMLDRDLNDPGALTVMASMFLKAAMMTTKPDKKAAAFEQAMSWNQRLIALAPNNPEPYSSLGVIAWAKVQAPMQAARSQLQMDAADPGPFSDLTVKADLQSQFGRTIDEGLVNLKKSLELNPRNDYAINYLNLLLKEKADLEDSEDAANADVGEANEWLSRLSTSPNKSPGEIAAMEPPEPGSVAGLHAQRIGRNVAEQNLLRKVEPVYPPLAKSARVQGVVEFTAIINPSGGVENLQLVRGHPLLVQAARQAVLQWKYRPVLLNGQAVTVITNVVVTFALSE